MPSFGREGTTLPVQNRQSIDENGDVVLYCDGTAVLKVEKGTTFGLTKMLYKATKCNDRIIGVIPREKSDSLVCIITQDLTMLTENEYDLITYENNEQSHPQCCQNETTMDKGVNTTLTFNPRLFCDNRAIARGSNIARSDIRYDDENITELCLTKGCCSVARPPPACDVVDISSVYPTNDTYVVKVNSKPERFNDMNTSCYDEEQNIVDSGVMCQSSSASPAVSDTDSLIGNSPKSPPSQIYLSPYEVRQSSHGTVKRGTHGEQTGTSRITVGNKKWQCMYCEKSFPCRSARENHQRTHTGERPFKCPDCGRSFSHQGNLKQHLYIHRDTKPFTCAVCGKGFTRPNRLRDHRQTHDNDNTVLRQTVGF